MSALNPGGSRSKGGRVFTAAGVASACERNAKRRFQSGDDSIANQPHNNSRAIARRLRQQARIAEKQSS